ncbi:MAG: hypothetical protein K0U41_09065 [Gammaproteobacteria bacterium]|nr:hypothetical protein [Gammaproteobacteria bacterium]
MEYELWKGEDFTPRLMNLINADIPLMVDTETCGLYGRIRLVQFYQPQFEKVILVEWPNPYQLMGMLNKVHPVFHNASYDISTIQRNVGGLAWRPETLDDTLYLSRLHFYKIKEGFKLDQCVEYATGSNPYNELDQQKKELQKTGWDAPVLTEEQKRYAALDVYYMQQLYDVVKEKREDLNYKLDIITLRSNLRMQCNGIPVDSEKLETLYAANMQEINNIALPCNCNSPKQVRAYIGSNMSDDLGLAWQIAHGNERAGFVRRARKLTKQNSFLNKFQTDDGHIYGLFKPGARSGRSTCNDQNLQQVPRALRTVFGVPEHGPEVMVYSDFSQLELRAICAITGDKNMLAIYRAGGDIHDYTARRLFNTEEPTKEQRQIGKTCNFALLYGAGWKVLQTILLKTTGIYLKEPECKDIRNRWLNLFPDLKIWQQQGIRDQKAGRPWQTPMGRRYMGKLMTDQVNIQVQGMGAEVAKLANHYMDKVMEELAAGWTQFDEWYHWQINFIHDAYLYRMPNDPDMYETVAKIIADSMQLAWKEISVACKIPDLPMPVNVLVGYNWGDLEAGKSIWEHKQ